MSARRSRLDDVLVDRGLIETRSKARALILAGDVIVNDVVVLRAGALIGDEDAVALRAKPRFVSRGGEKLAHAIDVFGIEVRDRVCADLGASTGGFTDCLLKAGAARLYAVDVGYGQLDRRIREDPRVIVMERTNARYLDKLPEPVSLVTIDVSFISLDLILPVAGRLLERGGWCIPLIKPQFEAGRGEVGARGVVRSPAVHRKVLEKVLTRAVGAGFEVNGLTRSPLRGPEGNIEFLAALHHPSAPGRRQSEAEFEELIDSAMREAT